MSGTNLKHLEAIRTFCSRGTKIIVALINQVIRFTFGLSLIVTGYRTYQEWNESQKRVLVLGEALIQWIKSGYPNIHDGKAYLDQIRKKLESGNL